MKISFIILFLLSPLKICSESQQKAQLDYAMENFISQRYYPGATLLGGNADNILFSYAYGNYTYGTADPNLQYPMSPSTLFDMASCTKILSTTQAIAQFYNRGELSLTDKISSPKLLGAQFSQNGKENITVENCLLHNAGYPPDPNPNYWNFQFSCPQVYDYHAPLIFACRGQIYNSLLEQTLINPVGAVYVYSDLSFITLMNVVGKLAMSLNKVQESDLNEDCKSGPQLGIEQCYYEAYVRLYVFARANATSTGFNPPSNQSTNCAPTENNLPLAHKQMQGQVSDQNAYVSGGIQGHAGLFTNIHDAWSIARCWLKECPGYDLNMTTIKTFSQVHNLTQSTRALGWDTNYLHPNDGFYREIGPCGNMSNSTINHLGYTGTEVCIDQEHQIISIFLTNRVYPTDVGTDDGINYARPFINTYSFELSKALLEKQRVEQKQTEILRQN